MNERPEFEAVPAIGISFKQTLDDYREVVFQGYIPSDCAPEQFNELLDKLSTAADRQKARTAAPTIRGLIAAKKQGVEVETNNLLLAQAEKDNLVKQIQFDQGNSGRRNWRPNHKQNQDYAQVEAKIADCEQKLRILDKEISAYTSQLSEMEIKLGQGG